MLNSDNIDREVEFFGRYSVIHIMSGLRSLMMSWSSSRLFVLACTQFKIFLSLGILVCAKKIDNRCSRCFSLLGAGALKHADCIIMVKSAYMLYGMEARRNKTEVQLLNF
jgi:hypothetical protein